MRIEVKQMKIITLKLTLCSAALGLTTGGFAGPLSAQLEPAQHEHPKHISYTVKDLGTLPGGPFSQAVGVSAHGLINGAAALPNGTTHAVLWYRDLITDLATRGLGGPNSGAFGANEAGQASGLGETATSDPNGEDFCGYGTHLICVPFLWHEGVMSPLPTLGGNNGEAGEINERGEVAGNAENSTRDSTCPTAGPQVLQEKPVVWENGHIKELNTFRDDPDGWAFGINDKGQVVGASGVCSPINPDTGVYVLSRHALLWERDRVTDLGNLGGTGVTGPGNAALEINNKGEVVGVSDLRGDKHFHAFFWTREKQIEDLGTLPGDADSSGLGVNDRGDVVGVSFDAGGNPRAFLRQNAEMLDLNAVAPHSPLYLLFAHGINSRGEIVGFGVTGAGDVHAFRATPCEGKPSVSEAGEDTAGDSDGEREGSRETAKVSVSEIRHRQLRFGRFGGQLTGPN
jgi:probable HAF family extracellular repeat protein